MLSSTGFEVIPDVLADAELTSLIAAGSGLRRGRAGARHLMGDGPVNRVARDRRLMDLASAALASPAEPYRATLFDKSPDANWLVVWHQDTALPLERRHEAEGWGPWSTKEGGVYAHAPASGVLVMRPLLVHASSKSAAPVRGVSSISNTRPR
jgi:hypothetical protein